MTFISNFHVEYVGLILSKLDRLYIPLQMRIQVKLVTGCLGLYKVGITVYIRCKLLGGKWFTNIHVRNDL